MKLAIFALGAMAISGAASAQVHVHGYTTKSGTYVAPYYRSSPDSSLSNNYSTKGNTNPYTGAQGTRSPYKSYGYTAPTYTPPTYGYQAPQRSDSSDGDSEN